MSVNPNYEILEDNEVSVSGLTAEGRPFYLRLVDGDYSLWVGTVGAAADDGTALFEHPALFYQGHTHTEDYYPTQAERISVLGRHLSAVVIGVAS